MSIFIPNSIHISLIYQVSLFIASVGILIATIEDLTSWKAFKSDGILSWNIGRSANKWVRNGISAKIANIFLSDTGFKVSFYIRLVNSLILIIFSALGIISPFLITLELILLSLVAFRSPYSLDGGYQMYLVILFGLSIGSLFGFESIVSMYCLYFISAQILLSYFISGITKFISSIWRKGYSIHCIFSTKVYGHAYVYSLIKKYKILAPILSWIVIITELFFFTVIFVDPKHIILYFIGGAVFHIGTGVLMGLNDFLLAFLATYPILYFCLVQPLVFS